MEFKIIRLPNQKMDEWGAEPRYCIADLEGKVIDDAQGYGYKSELKAQKAAWYHCSGGKQKIQTQKKEAKDFWKQNPEVKAQLIDLLEWNVKELMREEVTEHELIQEVERQFNVKIKPTWLRYL